jgi:hypothetical protein
VIASAKKQAGRIRHAAAQRALIASALASVLATAPGPSSGEPWAELGREISCTVWYDPQSIRRVDPDVIEIRLLYEGPGVPPWMDDWTRVRGCDVRIETLRVRCADRTFQVMEILEIAPGNAPLQADGAFPSWRPREPRGWHYPPGWRRDIQPATTYAAVHAMACANAPR